MKCVIIGITLEMPIHFVYLQSGLKDEYWIRYMFLSISVESLDPLFVLSKRFGTFISTSENGNHRRVPSENHLGLIR
jgi:hypothetical protein